MDIEVNTKKTIETLNGLLRGELSAVETYDQALQKIADNFSAKMDLEECRASHISRAERLRQTVLQLGGDPVKGSGPWGAFAKLIEGGAKLFGPSVAIAALEEGEDHGLKEYRNGLDKLDVPSRQLVSNELLPAQMRTHSTLSALKRSLAQPQSSP